MEIPLRIENPLSQEWITFPFRLDSDADFSIIPESFLQRLELPLEDWRPGLTIRTASGTVLATRQARQVRYEFLRLADARFRTDFAVSANLPTHYGLLAWRDVALDFRIRTTQLPRFLSPVSMLVGVPGIVEMCLRMDRFPDRIG